jgi:hypothetical protein
MGIGKPEKFLYFLMMYKVTPNEGGTRLDTAAL